MKQFSTEKPPSAVLEKRTSPVLFKLVQNYKKMSCLRVWRLLAENGVHINSKQGPEQLGMFNQKIGEPSESLNKITQKNFISQKQKVKP